MRAAILLTYLLTYSLTYLLTYCAPCCLPRGAHRRANTPTRRSTLRHLDSSSTASAQTRSPHCATDSTMWSPALRTALYAHLYAQRMQRHDRGRSPSGASAKPLPPGGETAVCAVFCRRWVFAAFVGSFSPIMFARARAPAPKARTCSGLPSTLKSTCTSHAPPARSLSTSLKAKQLS